MKSLMSRSFYCLCCIFVFTACEQSGTGSGGPPDSVLISSSFNERNSSTLGNLAATAVRETYKVDFAFLPAVYYRNKNIFTTLSNSTNGFEKQNLINMFAVDPQDQILIGAMRGRDIKEFLIRRSEELYNVDVETAGLWYNINFVGGIVDNATFRIVPGNLELEDDQIYRIAVSDDFYFGSAFPGYKYRNNFNFRFRRERVQRSIRSAVVEFLNNNDTRDFFLDRVRARVGHFIKGDVGFKEIHQIQGPGHASPLRAFTAKTRGIVTAVGSDPWYPYDLDIYIQSQNPDDDARTSEGLHITSQFNSVDIKVGQLVEVQGLVIEEMRTNGMGETTLFLNQPPLVLEESVELPEPISLANVPSERISHFTGPLISKKGLDVTTDGIDFWESVEGMRVQTRHLVVSGFRGGGEDLLPISDRFYLNLYVYSKDSFTPELTTQVNGLMPDLIGEDHNPELFVITTNHLSRGIDVQKSNDDYYYYNIGDEIAHPDLKPEMQKVVGVITYQRNLFGGGEYAMVLPEPQEVFLHKNVKSRGFVPLEQRPTTTFDSAKNPTELTIATLNLENLAGNRQDRIDALGTVLAVNLKCPDIVNLVEIQDDNGFSLRGGTSAELTLKRVRIATQQNCPNSSYDYINVDPFEQSEGGQPGGNIRIALLYNKDKLIFTPRGVPNRALGNSSDILKGGDLSLNPGRVMPLNQAFRRSRISPVIQLQYKSNPSRSLYLIGTHFNSKLGDLDFWGNIQPVVQLSENRRMQMAERIADFVRLIERENSSAEVYVLGDFNALAEEGSMQLLSQNGLLRNGIFMVPENERYTTNHNGNSQALDYIFMNRTVYSKPCTNVEVLHMNSNYMGRISDHDPLVLRTCIQ